MGKSAYNKDNKSGNQASHLTRQEENPLTELLSPKGGFFLRLAPCQSLSPWERWHCEAMTERASPARKSRRAAIGRLFVGAILSQFRAVWQHPCPLSRACARQLPQRGSPWHVGQLSSGRAKHDVPETVVRCCQNSRQLDKVRCPEAAGPVSEARAFAPHRASGVQ